MSIQPTFAHAAPSPSNALPAAAEPQRHTVQPAESLAQIANQYGVTPQDILKANPQVTNPDMIYPDDALVIPSRTSESSRQGVSISNTGGISASQSTRSDTRTTYTSDAGTAYQSTTSTTGNVSVNPDAGSVTASGGVSFNESVKSAGGYGVSFGGGDVSQGLATALGIGIQQIGLVVGALSVGIGFGLQAITQNFISGLILLAERPVKIGDWVRVGDFEGDVQRISVRATEIRVADRSTVIVPNSELITKPLRNMTLANPLGRVLLQFPVPLDTDVDRLRAILLETFAAHPAVLAEPARFAGRRVGIVLSGGNVDPDHLPWCA